MTQHEAELEKFQTLHNRFRNQPGYQSLDKYGFTTAKKPDILFTGLTHGNEVIGLQVINLFLEKALKSDHTAPYTFAILLNNIDAYNKNVRFVDKDLNRSFKSSPIKPASEKGSEHYRALEIEEIVKKLQPRFILDLHQTTEQTLSPFFMLPEDRTLILAAATINREWPIITFDGAGFSKDGKTLMEFAWSEKIPTLVIEISQNGFNLELAKSIMNQLFFLNAESIIQPTNKANVDYYKISHQLTKYSVGVELIPGFKNLQAIKANDVLGVAPNGSNYLCPADGLFIFPKYGRQAEVSHELGLIATRRDFSK